MLRNGSKISKLIVKIILIKLCSTKDMVYIISVEVFH